MIPTLASARLTLRPMQEGDGPLYCRLYTDPDVMRLVVAPLAPAAARRDFERAWSSQRDPAGRRRYWVLQAADGEALGLVGLALDASGGAELGVLLPPAHQGQGLATEAITALADHAFDAGGLRCLHTRHAAGHGLARGLMSTLGFESTATGEHDAGWRWQLTAARWRARAGDKRGPIR